MKTLEQYFRDSAEAGAIDHRVRATVTPGSVSFYIHPAGRSDTLDFSVVNDCLFRAVGNVLSEPIVATAETAPPVSPEGTRMACLEMVMKYTEGAYHIMDDADGIIAAADRYAAFVLRGTAPAA